ncbi:hypothetical protein [Aeromicrobium sp. UC242_57]|uniref:hypothetical protein n=1 Tax=Aeromicrobium sp. UC242_57 TaxID=3374624 RepID=UPI00378F14BC
MPVAELHDRGGPGQARSGFAESWQERLARIGLDQVVVSSLDVNYRTPSEVMAEAAPIIRAVLPDANVPRSIRGTGVPVRRGTVEELAEIVQTWLLAHAEGVACVISVVEVDSAELTSSRIRWLAPELSKGLEFDLVVLVDPESFGSGTSGAVDRYVAMTRATQQSSS